MSSDSTHFEGRQRTGPDGEAVERISDAVKVMLVDAYPDGRLQAQLDRIEAKLDGPPTSVGRYARAMTERCSVHPIGGWVVGPRKAGCTCARFPFAEERAASRWAAFTDDELGIIDSTIALRWQTPPADAWEMRLQIKAELERRKP